MSRWKPPKKNSSPYITPEGFSKLKQEYEDIWKLRASVTNALAAAAAEGDRSENAEYIYRKKELGRLDYRIRYLQIRIQEVNVVTEISDKNCIYFGARITLKDKTGKETIVRIVGADELTYDKENISIDSPMARALLGKIIDDEVTYLVNEKTMNYKIVNINY